MPNAARQQPPPPDFPIERPPWNYRSTWLLLAVLILVIDFIAGPKIQFPFLFIIPIMLVAWNCSQRCALSMTVALCAARFTFHFIWADGLPWKVALLNMVIRVGVLFLLACLTHRVARQTRSLRERVDELEGLLPICSHCKDIREDDGQWTKMEVFISHRTEAQFSHGICPKCAEKHYGHLFPKGIPAH